MISRRTFIATASAVLATGLSAEAQDGNKPVRTVGFLGVVACGSARLADHPSPRARAFTNALKESGYVEGQNLAIDCRNTEGRSDLIARFAQELAAKKVDAIVAYTTPLAQAALRATREIPIVFVTVTDPVRAGLVASLRNPGGNVTGIAAELQELSGKLLQMVRETKPGISRVSVFYNVTNDGKLAEFSELKSAAARLAVTLDPMPFRNDVELDAVLRKLKSERPQAVVGLMDALTAQHNEKIAVALLDARCPSFFDNAGVVEAGGLMSYAPKTRSTLLEPVASSRRFSMAQGQAICRSSSRRHSNWP